MIDGGFFLNRKKGKNLYQLAIKKTLIMSSGFFIFLISCMIMFMSTLLSYYNLQLNECLISSFALAHSLRDVCDIIGIAPEYALKVKSGIVTNQAVSACIRSLYSKDSFTFIFRQTFVHVSI